MRPGLASACLAPMFAALAAAAAPAAQARSTFCCTEPGGKQVCSDVLPPQCYGRAYREINERGVTVKRVDAPPTAEQRAQQEAELKTKQDEERKRMEQERQNRALLATYASERDIDYLRDRAVADLEHAIKQSRDKYDEIGKRRKKLDDEAEFYKKKELPPKLQTALRDNESDMKALTAAIAEKKKEIEAVKARYEGEKARYRELTAKGARP
ncbi:MAG: hypothetical protein HYZ19_01570 [Rhodocyclales bacterium]|nr:hypothetical protein [Rhodocyclales bacterium]